MRSFLGVPILVRDEVFGNLYLTDKSTARRSSRPRTRSSSSVWRRRQGWRSRTPGSAPECIELAVVEDRERIARDLHDTVIQRLFATECCCRARHGGDNDRRRAIERIGEAVDDLESRSRRSARRSSIWNGVGRAGEALRGQILSEVRIGRESLGFEPRVTSTGRSTRRSTRPSAPSCWPRCARR